jgi:hypothetical protein
MKNGKNEVDADRKTGEAWVIKPAAPLLASVIRWVFFCTGLADL